MRYVLVMLVLMGAAGSALDPSGGRANAARAVQAAAEPAPYPPAPGPTDPAGPMD